MSSNIEQQDHDPVINLTMQPVKGILKGMKSIDDVRHDTQHQLITTSNHHCSNTGMTRSESKR
jgi:hypothetical protein